MAVTDNRKVEALKSENDKLAKEARQSGTPGTAPRMMKTVRTGQASKQTSPAPLRDGERDLATVAASAFPSTAASGSIAPREDDGDTPALASSMSEDHNKKRQLTAISTSTRAQRGLFTPYESPVVPAEEVDVREIQERYAAHCACCVRVYVRVSVLTSQWSIDRLRRRSLSKRILDRLAYWENMQQRQVVPAAPSPLGSKSSGLASRGRPSVQLGSLCAVCLLSVSFFYRSEPYSARVPVGRQRARPTPDPSRGPRSSASESRTAERRTAKIRGRRRTTARPPSPAGRS